MKYSIKIVNSLLDNVHGFIGLTEIENQIEQLPVFKRLQDISQLGLANRIFPCALHNRYTHSLGVMHIADQMAIHLELSDDERQILRLAGLLHDIGHYPLSHDVESAYIACNEAAFDNKSDENVEYFSQKAKKEISQLDNEYVPKLFMKQAGSEYHHEVIGTKVIKNSSSIKRIIQEGYIDGNDLYNDIDNAIDKVINDICAIITGNAQHESEVFKDRLSILIQLMHSELDADRIDYLLRDATFSGASYGAFDIGQLIQNMRCCKYKNSYIVGVNKKGIGCAEQFLVNRYLAYSQIIYHKYTSVLGVMLQSIVRWEISHRESRFVMDNIHRLVEQHEDNHNFIGFTDKYLIRHINEAKKDDDSCPELTYKFIECIKNYRALYLNDEFVYTSLNLNEIKKSVEDSLVYKSMKDNDGDLYMFSKLKITKHIPLKEFETNVNRALAEGAIDEEMKELLFIDRLQEGIAVIEDGKDPYLLVDSERSMISSIYGLTYCVLRKYDINNT